MVRFFLVLLLLFANSLFAHIALCETQPLTVRASTSWYTIGTYQEPINDAPLNPGNSVLNLESDIESIDIRPNIKADGGVFQLVARPQFVTQLSRSKIQGTLSPSHPTSSGKWLEAFGLLTASDKVILSYGLQNYQWGAAETLNPSNRIFHDNLDNKGLLSTVEGRMIARANISWSKSISTVLMSETEKNNNLQVFRAEETFQTRALMKHEINWNSGSDYFGFVFGAPEHGSPWIGEYINATLFDGLAFYADASHQHNSDAWYPVVVNTTASNPSNVGQLVELQQSKINDGRLYSLAVLGLRYSFEGGSDLRFEFLYNSAGWSRDEANLDLVAIDSSLPSQLPDYTTNLHRSLKPGLDYRGQHYGMASLRVPDAFDWKDFVLYGRCLRSLSDGSTAFYGSMEYGFLSASTLFLSASWSTGSVESDLRGVIAKTVAGGLRQDF